MSRIYEALQRAESERQGERGESSIGLVGRSATLVAFEPEPAPPEDRSGSMPEPLPVSIREPLRMEPELAAADLMANIARRFWATAPDRLPALQERGPSVEQFRSLRSRIQEYRASRNLKSLLITSGLPQEGKSFIAANLAISLALHKNSKVLLIDGDMRRSTLHQYFGCEAQPGLADYLAGKASLLDIMQRPAAESTPVKALSRVLNNLVLLPAGAGGDKAADLASNRRFDELIRTLSPQFDWIIVDSSPVVPVSDAVSLARACDGVLLVARSGVTTFPIAQKAQAELKAANVLGFVLNAVETPPLTGSYYGYESPSE